MELWIGLIIGLLVGAIVAALIMRSIMQPKVDAVVAATEAELAEKRTATEREVETILRTSREEAQEIRTEAEKAIERRYQDLARAEERVDRRSANQDSQASKLELREQVLNKRQSKLDKRQNELADLETIHRQKLEEIAAMTTDEARAVLLQDVYKRQAVSDVAGRLRRALDHRQHVGQDLRRVELVGQPVPDAVSYTHLDVYKRQVFDLFGQWAIIPSCHCGVEQRQLVGLITRRSAVRIGPPRL